MRPLRSHTGFTLIEMLVGLALLAVLALISWRGLDALMRIEERSRERSEAVARLQTSLAQWRTDLNAAVETGEVSVLSFDGRVLRLTRSDAGSHPGALRVVGWARRAVGTGGSDSGAGSGGGQWLRWQSPPLYTAQALQQAWAQAGNWAQTPGPADKALEVPLMPIAQWQLFYFRKNAWSNPMSSEGQGDNSPGEGSELETLPDAVRLELVLPPGAGLAGRLSQDWLRPTFTKPSS